MISNHPDGQSKILQNGGHLNKRILDGGALSNLLNVFQGSGKAEDYVIKEWQRKTGEEKEKKGNERANQAMNYLARKEKKGKRKV